MPTIKINKEDSVLKLSEDGTVEMHIPNLDDDDSVPQSVITITLLGVMLTQKDKEFFELMSRKYTEYFIEKMAELEE